MDFIEIVGEAISTLTDSEVMIVLLEDEGGDAVTELVSSIFG